MIVLDRYLCAWICDFVHSCSVRYYLVPHSHECR
uniref:Uncharacterized protein n=1 Tax=Rhizophora mucronata TaxID=61149 RepID=A0A2P2PV57_RHIMU